MGRPNDQELKAFIELINRSIPDEKKSIDGRIDLEIIQHRKALEAMYVHADQGENIEQLNNFDFIYVRELNKARSKIQGRDVYGSDMVYADLPAWVLFVCKSKQLNDIYIENDFKPENSTLKDMLNDHNEYKNDMEEKAFTQTILLLTYSIITVALLGLIMIPILPSLTLFGAAWLSAGIIAPMLIAFSVSTFINNKSFPSTHLSSTEKGEMLSGWRIEERRPVVKPKSSGQLNRERVQVDDKSFSSRDVEMINKNKPER